MEVMIDGVKYVPADPAPIFAPPVVVRSVLSADITAWTRQWFHEHQPATRDDFDLPHMLHDFLRMIDDRASGGR